jgi:hypothetical protein
MVDLDQEALLDVLSDVHDLLFNSKNWSQSSFCFKDGRPSKPIEADQFSLMGAIERTLVSQDKYDALSQVISELEKDNTIKVSDFDEQHSHRELLEYLYNTLDRMAENLGYNMYLPLFPIEDNNDPESFKLFFVSKGFDEELERQEKEEREREDARKLREAEELELAVRMDRE